MYPPAAISGLLARTSPPPPQQYRAPLDLGVCSPRGPCRARTVQARFGVLDVATVAADAVMNSPNAHAHPPRERLDGARSLDELVVSPVPSLHGAYLDVAQGGWSSSKGTSACDSPLDARWPIAFAAIARNAAVDNVRVHTQPGGQLLDAPMLSPEFLPARMPCENLANLRVGEFSRRTAPKTHDDSHEVCRRSACTLGRPHPIGRRSRIEDGPLGPRARPARSSLNGVRGCGNAVVRVRLGAVHSHTVIVLRKDQHRDAAK